jgi:enoyl-CoA hydratase
MSGEVRVELQGRTLWLTIDREERRNALSGQVLAALLAAVRDPGAGTGAIVIASAGERVFCSGADLAVMSPDATGLEQHEARGLLTELILAVRGSPLPVLARVQGLCLAGGLALVMAADVAVASDAAKFGLPEVDLGLWPFIVSALLGRHVSPKRAMDLMLTGERIDADTAGRWGLVSRVLPAAEFDDGFRAIAEAVADKPPVAVRLGKAAFNASMESTLAAGLAAMQAQLSLLTTTQDAAEGIKAFFEKRPPRWTGR